MKHLLPAPLLTAVLFLLWLLLNRSASAGHILLATLVAIAVPLATRGLRPLPVRVRRPGAMLRLGVTVMADTIQSNLDVMKHLLRPASQRPPAAFVQVPLQLRDPNALAVLAMIVCITPGTAWAELSRDRTTLLLHVLDGSDPHALVHHVQTRYEQPLLEIFT